MAEEIRWQQILKGASDGKKADMDAPQQDGDIPVGRDRESRPLEEDGGSADADGVGDSSNSTTTNTLTLSDDGKSMNK